MRWPAEFDRFVAVYLSIGCSCFVRARSHLPYVAEVNQNRGDSGLFDVRLAAAAVFSIPIK